MDPRPYDAATSLRQLQPTFRWVCTGLVCMAMAALACLCRFYARPDGREQVAGSFIASKNAEYVHAFSQRHDKQTGVYHVIRNKWRGSPEGSGHGKTSGWGRNWAMTFFKFTNTLPGSSPRYRCRNQTCSNRQDSSDQKPTFCPSFLGDWHMSSAACGWPSKDGGRHAVQRP